jgi:hypothetical protein
MDPRIRTASNNRHTALLEAVNIKTNFLFFYSILISENHFSESTHEFLDVRITNP